MLKIMSLALVTKPINQKRALSNGDSYHGIHGFRILLSNMESRVNMASTLSRRWILHCKMSTSPAAPPRAPATKAF